MYPLYTDNKRINYASNPHLEYVYPPLDDDILCNILNAIQNVPKLYVQVLHLMNKMNLPPPFRSPPSSALTIDYPSLKKKLRKKIRAANDDQLSSDESELSDEANETKQVRKRPPIVDSEVLQPPHKKERKNTDLHASYDQSNITPKPKKQTPQISIEIRSLKDNEDNDTPSSKRWTLEG